MKRKVVFFSFLLALTPALAWAEVIADTQFNSLTEGGVTCNGYPGAPMPEIVSVSNSPNPSNVIKVNFPAGYVNGYNTMYCSAPKYDSDEIYAQVYVFFPTGYQWHLVGNKISYTYLKKVENDNPGNFYIGIFGTDRKIAIHLQPNSSNGTPNQVLYSNYTIQEDTWYKITWYMKLNTSGQTNGIVKMWANDKLIYESYNRALRGGIYGTRNFYATSLVPIWGGLNKTSKSVADYFYFDRFIVSTTPIGGLSGDAPTGGSHLVNIEPNPPIRLTIK